MKREDLKAKGLTDEQIDFIMAENGKDIEAGKTKLTTVETELAGLKTQLTEASTTIEGFKKLDVNAIKAAADDWKAKAERAAADGAAQVAALKFDHALEAALTGAKVRDVTSVRAHLRTDALKMQDDGSILGLKEQLDALKTAKDFLFEADEGSPRVVTGGKSKTVLTDAVVDAARKAAGLPVGDK